MSLNLQVTIDENAGFCFGVERAVEIAEGILNQGDTLYCLGQMVHNREEVSRLEAMGMISITHQDLSRLSGQKVLIRSHGEPPETYELLRKNGNEIIEATCPIVLKLQERIRKTGDADEFVLIYGKKDHPEVIGLAGQLEANYQIFQQVEDLDLCRLPERLTVYSQTTMDVEGFGQACAYLTEKGFKITPKDTICRKVSGKTGHLTEFASSYDVIIMVAGQNSSNGKVLHGVCLAANPRSYKLTTVEEIQRDWFSPGDRVGVTGATSTPRWQMEKIAAWLSDR